MYDTGMRIKFTKDITVDVFNPTNDTVYEKNINSGYEMICVSVEQISSLVSHITTATGEFYVDVKNESFKIKT